MTVASTSFVLTAGPLGPEHVAVDAWSGTESLSRPYDLRVQVSTRLPPALFERAVFGASATLYRRAGGHDNRHHGLVCAVRYEGQRLVEGRERHRFTVRLVPHLWLLGRRKGSQIFQDMPISAVLGAVLGARGLPFELRLAEVGPPRAYCTQYEETELAFVRRLCAVQGYVFWFAPGEAELTAAIERALDEGARHAERLVDTVPPPVAMGSPRERIVIADHPAYDPIEGGPLPLHGPGFLAAPRDFAGSFSREQTIVPTSSTVRQFDYRRPLVPVLGDASGRGDPRPDLEVYEHETIPLYDRGMSIPALGAAPLPTDVLPDVEHGPHEALRNLDAHRRRRAFFRGTSSSVRLFAGARFALEGSFDADGEYAVTTLHHEGRATGEATEGSAYTNRFECVPSDVKHPMKRPRRRPVQTCLTAIVAGPPGEEIHVDDAGRIKVRFHWDRSPNLFEPTCWLRAMQAWAGPAWGFQFIPRVGMEVVVGFEGGDPDKPIVLGSVFNGVTPTPFQTPRHKTKSGIRTRSTPRSEGYNELSFEDAAGEEEIVLKAQRNFTSQIGRDRSENVAHDDALTVGALQTIGVAGDRSVHVGGDETVDVSGARRDRVAGRTFVDRTDLEETIRGDRSVHVEKSDRQRIDGEVTRAVRGDLFADLLGNAAVLVGRDGAERSATLRVEGTTELSSSGAIDIASDKEIVLRVGGSYVRITDGDIEIVSEKVTARGKDARLLLAEGSAKTKVKSQFQVVSDDSVVLKSSKASVLLKSEAKIDGSRVLLNSPANASDTIVVTSPQLTTVELVDQDENPVPYQRFRIELDDGSEVAGFLDADGKAEVDVQGQGQIFFPDLSDPQPA